MRAKTATSASSSTRRSALRTSKTYADQNRGRSRTKREEKGRDEKRSLEAELEQVVDAKKQKKEPKVKEEASEKTKDKGGKKDKGKKGDKSEKTDKMEKKDKGQKSDKSEKSDKMEKKDKGKKNDKSEKSDKMEKKVKDEGLPLKNEKDNKDKKEKKGKESKEVKTEVKKVEQGNEKAVKAEKVETKDKKEPKEKPEDEKKRQRSGSAKTEVGKKEKGEETSKKQKKDPPIVFRPARKEKIEHIFTTPECKATRSPSPPRLTSKEKAEKRFEELAKHLKESDLEDDDSSCPASDIERTMNGEMRPAEAEAESEDEGEEEQEEEDQEEDEEDEEDEEKAEETESEADDSRAAEKTEEEVEETSESSSENASEKEEAEEGESEEAQKKEKGSKTPPEQHALVPVTTASEEKALALRNSVTHKKEWDQFCRTAKGTMPVQLSDMYLSSKQELFNIWVESGRDWSKCQMEVERKQEAKNIGKRGWKAIQAKELKQKYTPEKFEKFKASRLASGLFYKDPDFPDDEDDSRLELNLFGWCNILVRNYQKGIIPL